eukprot:8926963-Pyramimonas_sp.AAC.2
MRAQQLRSFAVLTSQESCADTVQDRQDATVRLIRCVGIPRTLFQHGSGYSNSCLPTRHFPLWT